MGRLIKFKSFFLDLLSFGTPQAKVINFSLMLLISILVPTKDLHYLPIRSIWRDVFKIEPYSVGLTRAMSRLFHGDLIGAWNFNKLVFPVAVVVIWLLIGNLIKSIKYYKKTGEIYPKLSLKKIK